ncbi:superoxide dismutase [Cu-Zn] [Galendromus occidentalis]|uniref:Superoxide dismutase [Cu-Zn] n=1 Tax=Galendromus occidentalis TaxID=34638 RepID=A0AAJ6QQP6_9ACAR|nr:superoxide dismutase [Cu-Zn] [Galendromus occidentalis]
MKAFVSLACMLSCASSIAASPVGSEASCYLAGTVTGKLSLRQIDDSLTVEGTLQNVPVGVHAIHVHEHGKLGNNCLESGGHYNPLGVDHGAKDDKTRHVGDWGNFNATQETLRLSITDNVAKLNGEHSIMGRAIVIHEKADDLGRGGNPASKANGNAGARIACCVIEQAM